MVNSLDTHDPAYGFPYCELARILAVLGLPVSAFVALDMLGTPWGTVARVVQIGLGLFEVGFVLNVLGTGPGFRWIGAAGALFAASGLAQNAGLLILAVLAPTWGVNVRGALLLTLPPLLIGGLFLTAWRHARSDT